MIVDFEIQNNVCFTSNEDFDIDDEIISEEEMLKIIQDSVENKTLCGNMNFNGTIPDDLTEIFDQLDDIENIKSVQYEMVSDVEESLNNRSNLDVLFDPSAKQLMLLKEKAQQQAKNVSKKMEKICVAPGEKGNFLNWGEDTFLEERCFPELFPFGTGGYLSSCVEDPDRALGFAEYCVGQLMSCDSKFRMNTSYIFFLLLVRELIHTKRCISTFMRQATRLPTLNKQNLANINNEDLTRYNRSYQVFHSLRGTAPYYEKSKLNLMALIRQKRCPSIFLTL